MQQPLVIKQGTPAGQVSLQPNMVTVPMSMNTNLPANVMTLTKPGGQNVVATSQNMGGTQQIIPGVQILNMRPGTPVSAQKSVATVSPRVVIGQQVVGARPAAPGITLQTLQGLQPGQQGHLLLKTETGQYQLLRVGPAPSAGAIGTAPTQTIRLSTVPTHPGVATVSTSIAQAAQIQSQVASAPVVTPVVTPTPTPAAPPPAPVPQRQSDNTKEKCRNFLANLLDLSSKEPKSVERNVRTLIQELIDANVEPEQFCDRLERLLNASPQPCLIGFLKKSLPLLRQSLVTKELVIEGINPPAPHVVMNTSPMVKPPTLAKVGTQLSKPGTIVFQNIPIQNQKINALNKVSAKTVLAVNKGVPARIVSTTALNTVVNANKTLAKEKPKKPSTQFASQPFTDDKMAGDDDINDVAAMGGVNLAEESQRILGSTEMIGTQIRSCKEEYFVPVQAIQARLKAAVSKHGLDEPSHEVASLLSLAVHERLKNIIEKLATIARYRVEQAMVKCDPRYEITQDVKGQLQFLKELDELETKKRDDCDREMLLKAAKSRSINENPELKAKGKEMQRLELEEKRHQEANLTALQAIGPRKKPRLDLSDGDTNGFSQRNQMSQPRIRRINRRDLLFFMEQEKEAAHSLLLYRSYLK